EDDQVGVRARRQLPEAVVLQELPGALPRPVVERLLPRQPLVDRDADRVRVLRLARDHVREIAERRVRRGGHRVGGGAPPAAVGLAWWWNPMWFWARKVTKFW